MNDAFAATTSRHRQGRWRRFALRGARSAAAGVVIALCLWATMRHPLGLSLVYSLCISVMCWLFIDVARDLVASRMPAALLGSASAGGAWPGWIWMLAIVVVGAVLGYAAGNAIANRLTGLDLPGPFNADARQALYVLVLAIVPAVVITYFFQSREVIALQRADVERAERQAAEQQLMLLESQLEPHMLFNTLANLRALIGVDAERAVSMLDHLIAYLRASLAGSRERLHPIADEFARLADYLALMRVRMGPRLVTSFELPPALAGAQVPPLLLQPLVENSVKHGLEPKVAGGRIDIAARREGDALVLTVRDNGGTVGDGADDPAGASAEDRLGDGFGLAHVRARLATLYGADASFELTSVGDAAGGTLATVRLPFSTAPAAAHSVAQAAYR